MPQPPRLALSRSIREYLMRLTWARIAAIMSALGPIRSIILAGPFTIRRGRCSHGCPSFLIGGINWIGEFATRRLIAGAGNPNQALHFRLFHGSK